MAVEIPVIIDIQRTFREAASLVSSAAKPLESAIDQVALEASNKLTRRLSNAVAKFNKNTQDPDRMDKYANSINNAARAIKKMAEEQGRLTMGKTDVRDLYTEIQTLSNKWRTAKKSWKFDDQGNLRSQAMDLVTALQKAALKMEGFARAEQYAAMAAEKHQQELSREIVSIDDLNVALAAWRKEINAAAGNPLDEHFANAARMATQLEARLQGITNNIKILGSNAGSIDQLQSRIAELNRQFSALSASDRRGAAGKGILDQYRQLSIEMEKEVKTAAQIVQEEKARAAAIEKITKTRKYENAVLNQSSKSMKILQEQERILSDRLQRTQVGTKKFQELARRLAEVRKELEHAEAVVRRGGEEFRNLGNSASTAATKIGTTNAALSKQGGIMRMLTGYLSGYTAIFAGLRFIHNIRETTAELELQKVALGSILQDSEKAVDMFRDIKAAALKSPFEIKDLVTYTKQLAAYRIEQDKLFDTTMKLADVSAGLGVDMNRLILAYGQVRAASVLRGQELRQFTEAGIPLVEELAKKFEKLGRAGTTTADVFELISKRAVPFSMIEEIFNDMTDAGGIFYKMQEKQSETLKGQWMKLKDAITIMYDEMGNTQVVHDFMTGFIKDMLKLTRSWKEVSRWISGVINLLIVYKTVAKASALATTQMTAAEMRRLAVTKASTVAMPKFLAAIISETTAKKINRFMTKRLEIAQYRLAAANTIVGKSFWKLYAALLKNPYAAAAAAVIALVSAIVILIKNSREAAITVDEMDQSLSRFKDEAQKASDTQKLVASYERLSKKAEKTAEEIDELRRVTNELSRTYSSAVVGINKETGALEINIEKVKELSRAEYELEMARIRRDEKRTRKRVAELEKEREQITRNQQVGGHDTFMGGWVKWTEDELAEMGTRLKEIRDEVEPLKRDLEQLGDLMFIGPLPPPDLKTKEGLKGWKKILYEIQKEAEKAGSTTFFTTQDIEKLEHVKDLWKQTKDGIDKYKTELESIQHIQKTLTEPTAIAENLAEEKKAKANLDFWEKVQEVFNFIFKSSGENYQQDPFIKQLEERMKFMKDFKKGYDDLNKYLSHNDALAKQAEIMRSRGLALDLSPDQQTRAAGDLSQWYEDEMNRAWEKAKKHGATGKNIEEFLSKQIDDATNKGKALRDYQKLIQSLFDAKTDYDTSELTKRIEGAIQNMKEEIKQSEAARNFFQDILDTTGDQDLATNLTVSIYGGIGKDFRDRMEQQINDAIMSLDLASIPDDVFGQINVAAVNQDFETLMKFIGWFPQEYQKMLRDLAQADQKHYEDIAKNLVKSLKEAKTYSEKRVEIANQAAKRLAEIDSLRVDEDTKKALRSQNAKKAADDEAKLTYDTFKETPMYVELFANLDAASTRMLTNMREQLSGMKQMWKDNLNPTELKELQSRMEELDKQIASRNPFTALQQSIRKYQEMTKQMSRKEAENNAIERTKVAEGQKELLAAATNRMKVAEKTHGINSEEYKTAQKAYEKQKQLTEDAIKNAEAAQETATLYRKVAQQIKYAADEMRNWTGFITESLDAIREVVDTVASDDVSDVFGIISDGIGKTLGGLTQATGGIGRVMAGDLGGILDIIKGVGSTLAGIFGTATQLKIRAANKQIENQQKIIDNLERTYEKLSEALADSFDNDYLYNYTQQIENLQAQVDAYRKQAEAERSKGKKADENKALEYERNAEDAMKRIEEAGKEMQSFFAGSDLTSLAADFSSAWLDAYQEFGETAGAIEQRMEEMVKNIVEKAMLSGIVQNVMGDWYESLKNIKDWNAQTIAEKVAEARNLIPVINQGLNNAANELNAAGLTLRGTVGQFTGISRDIAGASEESINGLAAGINTQNFFLQHIDANVMAIVAALTGESEASAARRSAAAAATGNEDQALVYSTYIPEMHDDLREIRLALDRVVKLNGNKYAVQVQM